MKLTPEDETSDQSLSRGSTKKLIFSVNAMAICLPLFLAAVIWGLASYFGVPLERKHWRQIVMGLWLSTLIFLVVYLWWNRRGVPRRPAAPTEDLIEQKVSPTDVVQTWEFRSTRRLGRELLLALFLVPAVALLLVVGYFKLQGIFLLRKDWIRIVAIVWVGSLVAFSRGALFSRRSKLLYQRADDTKPAAE